VRPGAIQVPSEESLDSDEFGSLLDQALNQVVSAPVDASRAGNRINFSGAIDANFTNLINRGVFTDVQSDGRVTAGRIPVNFLAADTAQEIASRMVAAINANTPLTAVQRGTGAELQGGAVFSAASEPPLRVGGTAPGGDITGMAFVNGRLFAVTGDDPRTFNVVEGGGLYEIYFASSNFAFADYIETASDLLTAGSDRFGNPGPIQFTALTAGPPNAENGRYSNMLFGMDVNGVLYAFDTTGALQPVFLDGETSIDTGLSGVDGLAFSNLDFNLWHETDARQTDPGHGTAEVFDGSRRAEPTASNRSFYFGYESPQANGVLSNPETNPANAFNYDFIGGAHGTLISNPFSLEGYSAADLPMLYYTYLLQTENANADLTTTNLMRDSFRAYISGEDGVWYLLSTNNSDRGPGDLDDEFDDLDPLDAVRVNVQENFDVRDGGAPVSWRQARISLSPFAGQKNLRIKFDFDTAGGRGPSASGFSSDFLRQATVGFELRTVEGARLRDGQQLTLSTLDSSGVAGSQDVFELDYGYTLVAPSGAAIVEGSSFTVDGIDYIFDSDGFFARNIQAIAGSALRDGLTFQVGDGALVRTFEFEDLTVGNGVASGRVVVSFRPTENAATIATAIASAVSGAGLNVTVRVNGSVVELTSPAPQFAPLNSGLQLASAFGVSYTKQDSAARVGQAIANAIAANPPATPVLTGDLTAESNDTILTALDSTLTGSTAFFSAPGTIGDNFNLSAPGLDVDFISFVAQVGDRITINLDANALGSTLNAMMTLFDSQGTILARSFAGAAPGEPPSSDPYLAFTATVSGRYFIAVSGEPNAFFDPYVAPSGQAGSTGSYVLEIDIADAAGLLHRDGHRVNLPNAQTVSVTGLGAGFIEGAPGIGQGFAINLHAGMTAAEVAEAIANSLSSFYSGGERQTFKTAEEIVNVVGHVLVGQSTGLYGLQPLGVSEALVGDLFGAFEQSTNVDGTTSVARQGALGMQNNTHEGVYVDDIVIGFAERGELVSGASGATNFVANPLRVSSDIERGEYQVEIRRAPEYGVSDPPPVPTFPLLPLFGARAFDTNDRQTKQASLTVPAGQFLADGQQLIISDGLNQLVFEFDDLNLPTGDADRGVRPGNVRVGFRASQTSNQMAELLRDTINSAAVQQVLKITAGLADGINTGTASTSTIINLYGNANITTASVDVAGSINAIFSSFQSDDLFTFTNQANERIARIELTLPDGLYFEPEVGGNRPLTAPSGPDVNASSDPVGETFTFRRVTEIDDTVLIDFANFDPGDQFIFGIDVDLSNDPVDYIGTRYTITFASGKILSGEFVAQGVGPGQVAVLDLGGASVSVNEFAEFGDQNVVREQGQVLIHSNRITNSLGVGILVDAGSRDISSLAPLAGNLPHAGPTRVTREVNTQRLVPGVSVVNNIVSRSGAAGIRFSGDVSPAGQQLASVPFGRIVNNTVVNAGIGIQVDENASPTLLNNIVARATTGISVDATSSSTVIGGTIYQGNTTNVQGATEGSFPLLLTAEEPLFVDASLNNFYLAPSSRAVDSSIDSLLDRAAMVTVREPLGISRSPILAPAYDAIGQRRVDDSAVNTPPGLGQDVFKDRGALDRSDFVGPSAVLVSPQDNDAARRDMNPAATVVELNNELLRHFTIQLLDGVEPADPQDGTGADDATVRGDRVSVFRDGVRLLQGLDYSFNYDATNNRIRLTPLAGLWELNHVYEIRLSNLQGFVLAAPTGDVVTDGDQFTVTDEAANSVTFEYESGYSLRVPQTLTLQIPATGGAAIADGETFTITNGTNTTTFEFDRNGVFTTNRVLINYTVSDTANELANKIVTAISGVSSLQLSPKNILNFGGRAVHLGSTSTHTLVTTSTSLTQTGVAAGIERNQTFQIDDGSKVVTFQFTNGTPSVGNRPIVFAQSMTHEELADAIVTAIRNASLGLTPTHPAQSEGLVHVGGEVRHRIDLGTSRLSLSGAPGVRPAWGLQIPTVAGAPNFNLIQDGETFTLSNGANTTVTFELDHNNVTTPGNVIVRYNRTTTTTTQLANALAIAIRDAGLGLSPTNAGLGRIVLGGTNLYTLNTTTTTLVQVGAPGVAAAEPVRFVPGTTYTTGSSVLTPITSAATMANSIAAAVNSANTRGLLVDVAATTNQTDGEVVMTGVDNATGVVSLFRSDIRDYAGNTLKANREDGTTQFTIVVGNGVDYGDAPAPYATLEADNGARHQVVSDFFLGNSIDIDFNGQPTTLADGDDQDGSDDEDGVTGIDAASSTLVGSSQHSIIVTASKVGRLDAWIDYNRDGDWNDAGEQVFASQVLVAGANVLTFVVPGTASQGTTMARFRLSSTGGLTSTGYAADGEVEDYQVNISGNPWRNPVTARDVNNDGSVSAIDALVLINSINRGDFPAQSPLPSPPNRPVPPYLDTNGDGYLTSADVLLVINFLNTQRSGEGEGEGEAADLLSTAAFSSSWVVDHRLDFGSTPSPQQADVTRQADVSSQRLAASDLNLWSTQKEENDHADALAAVVMEQADELDDLLDTLAADAQSDASSSSLAAHRDWLSRLQ